MLTPKFAYWDPNPALGTNYLTAVSPNASSPGWNYALGDILVPVEGGASGGQLQITQLQINGPVMSIAPYGILGENYLVGDVISITQHGGGLGCTAQVTATTTGSITSGSPNASKPGSGYAVNDILTVVQSGGSGGQLKVTAIATLGSIGAVSPNTIAGSGYAVNDILNIVQGSAAGGQAQVTAVATGPLLSASPSPTSPGINYQVGDILTVPGGSGTAQIQVATLTPGGGIQSVTSLFGINYQVGDILSVVEAGAGGGQVEITAIVTHTGKNGNSYTTIAAWVIVAPGTGYTSASSLNFTGGSGNGSAQGTIVAGGSPASYTVYAGGSGYSKNSAVSPTGGSGTGAVISILAGGIPTSYSVQGGGTGYSTASALTTTGGSGTGAEVNITASGTTGIPTAFSLQAGGSGYSPALGLSVTGGTGTGALIDIKGSGGRPTAYTILTPGSNYTSGALIVTGGSGTGPADVVIQAGGVPLVYAVINSGTGYTATTGLTTTGGSGTGAQVNSQIANTGGAIVDLTPTWPPVNKVPFGPYEPVRHDSITSSGIKQSVVERVDTFLELDFQNVPASDMAAWGQMMYILLQGAQFDYYPDSTVESAWQSYTIEDMDWSPKKVSWNNYSFKLKLRAYVGTAQYYS